MILAYPILESSGNTSHEKLSAALKTCLVLYQLYIKFFMTQIKIQTGINYLQFCFDMSFKFQLIDANNSLHNTIGAAFYWVTHYKHVYY